MFGILTIGPVVSLSDSGRFYCITLLWGGLELANLVWLKNCGRWFVMIKFGDIGMICLTLRAI